MASIVNESNGCRRIEFTASDGKRKKIRLGKCGERYAKSIKPKIEDLVHASIVGHAPKDATTRWVAELDDPLHDKLAHVGLVRPRSRATIDEFTREYIDGRSDIKPGTRRNLDQCRAYLLECFDRAKGLHSFNKGDAEEFEQHMIQSGRGLNTRRRAIGRARQFFTAARRRGLVDSNPFDGISAAVRSNEDRFHFVTRAVTGKLLDACPNLRWRLIVAVARYGGLRCPSEVGALAIDDIFWDQNRIRVPSPKTAHLDGHASRIIPLFPELRPLLLDAFQNAEPGSRLVVAGGIESRTNLRTQLRRIIKRAGVDPWQKPFQNMRSTRQTELLEEFPIHVVCKWMGNSEPVAARHYLQTTDEHFERAIGEAAQTQAKAAQNAAQKMHETDGNGQHRRNAQNAGTAENTGNFNELEAVSARCKSQLAPGQEANSPTNLRGIQGSWGKAAQNAAH